MYGFVKNYIQEKRVENKSSCKKPMKRGNLGNKCRFDDKW